MYRGRAPARSHSGSVALERLPSRSDAQPGHANRGRVDANVPYTHYERLTAVDAAFLEVEDHNVHMHVGAVAVFEGEALRTPDGAIDIERVREYVGSALNETPRFRQKLAYVPLLKHPLWVDDERFNLRYHVRHSALPPPGDDRQLKRLAARVMSQQLERNKPMWEMWVVEGLKDGRFALVVKAHHCMVDGIAGIDLLAALLRFEPERKRATAGRPWIMRRDRVRMAARARGRRGHA